MKAKIDLFYEKHPYLSLLINLLLGSIIGISVEYLLNKDFIGSGFYTVLFLSVLEAFSIYRKSKKKKITSKSLLLEGTFLLLIAGTKVYSVDLHITF